MIDAFYYIVMPCVALMSAAALLLSALSFYGLTGARASMVTTQQLNSSLQELGAQIDRKFDEAASRQAETLEGLREDYARNIEAIASIRGSHDAIVRTTDQMSYNYARIQERLIERLIDMSVSPRPSGDSPVTC